MSERETLEKQARDLGVSFAPNIGDEKLIVRIEEARAKADQQAQTDPQDTQGADGTADAAKAHTAAVKAATAATGGGQTMAPADEALTITVMCHREDGRRRVGRRWPKGETTVPADELSDFQIAQLEADPQFTVKKG